MPLVCWSFCQLIPSNIRPFINLRPLFNDSHPRPFCLLISVRHLAVFIKLRRPSETVKDAFFIGANLLRVLTYWYLLIDSFCFALIHLKSRLKATNNFLGTSLNFTHFVNVCILLGKYLKMQLLVFYRKFSWIVQI